jgi:hypothetical protein
MKKLLAALFLAASAGQAQAVEFHFAGYGDVRSFVPSSERSWVDGGLGKTRFGSEYNTPGMFGEAVGEASAVIFPGLQFSAVARIAPTQKVFVDFLEAYARYRPVSTNAWRFTGKAGAFFAPVSLEHTDIGWTSPWTLTPSAINTWVGEEFRTIGSEGTIDWRNERRTISFMGAAYGWNDPAGILLAYRGWSLNDRITGNADHLKIPDAFAIARRQTIPQRTLMFHEIDNKIGWYAGGAWEEKGIGKIQFLRYDNEANPAKSRTQIAWETTFWSLGAQTQIGNVTLITQGMIGDTFIRPSATTFSDTYYESAFLLAGWELGTDWRLAARFDYFGTQEKRPAGGRAPFGEHGNALTFAVNYLPNDWLRVTAELLRIDSTRTQRTIMGDPARAEETQFQLSFRSYLQ